MKFIRYTLFILAALSMAHPSMAADNKHEHLELAADIKELKNTLHTTNNKLTEVRRDQLNYKIEKDLLKETYSSNIQTINIVIALILGVFTVIGYLGVKSIGALRNDFKDELDSLTRLRDKYKAKFEEIYEQQKNTQRTFELIETKNKEQDDRLKVLEIQEKVDALLINKDYTRALEYLSTGLSISENDTILLGQKGYCLMKQHSFTEAMRCMEKSISNDPNQYNTVANYFEICLLLNENEKYHNNIDRYKQKLTEINGPFLLPLYDAIILTNQDDLVNLKSKLEQAITDAADGKLARIKDWNYDEITSRFESQSSSSSKLLLGYCSFLEGMIDLQAFKEQLSQL